MDVQEFLAQNLIEFGSLSITTSELLQIVGAVGGICLLGFLITNRLIPYFYEQKNVAADLRPRARRVTISAVVTFSIIAILRILELDFELYETVINAVENEPESGKKVIIRISNIMKGALILVIAGLVDWSIEELLIQRYHRGLGQQLDSETAAKENINKRISRAVSPVVYSAAILLIDSDLGIAGYEILTLGQTTADEKVVITLNSLIAAILVFNLISLFVLLVTRFAMIGYYRRSNVDRGSQYALNRLLTYLAYFIGILLVLQTAGFSLIGLWTGAAALLVGIGIGLQQTFNDLICGIIILFERSVKVGDVLDMGGPEKIGTVKKIGTRTSQVETRDNIILYVPNSKLIGDSVVNWSQTKARARFHVVVGVAYGSDTSLVKKILLEVADKHGKVLKNPKPIVRFLDFGSSSLDFDLLFYVSDFQRVEDIRSDLRFLIDSSFRSHGIEIPFPQQDLWIRGGLHQETGEKETEE